MTERKRSTLDGALRFAAPLPEPEPEALEPEPPVDAPVSLADQPCERPAAGHVDACTAALSDRSAWCAPCRARAQRDADG